MRSRLVVPVLVAGIAALSACGGGGGGSSSDTTASVDADVVVHAIDPLAWDKSAYTAKAGEVTIAAENDSSQPHNLHVIASDKSELPIALDIPSRGDVKTGKLTLAAGTYSIICTIPGHTNMKATLTVS